MKEFFIAYYPQIILGVEILYFIGVILLSAKIIIDTKTTSKTLAYLLLIIFLPVVGIIIYFVFGVNFRKNTFFNYKIERNEEIYSKIKKYIEETHRKVLAERSHEVTKYENTSDFLFHSVHSPLTQGNEVQLLINGEEKFPKVFEAIKAAKHHIHLEYYIYANDDIGNRLADALIEKSREGIEVRFMYDDLGSNKIGKELLSRLREAGVEVTPVNKIKFKLLANRVNYRDHRKIIIIDGREVFTGGINVSDKYINPNQFQYWRDTHLYIKGSGAFYFQFMFFTNWILTNEKMIDINPSYFDYDYQVQADKIVQAVPSGPDMKPAIMLSSTSSIFSAKKRIYITTPYFIPVESVLNAIKQQAMAGLDVRLLVPKNGDSVFVNAAAYSYYGELLEANVRIFFYEKGFVHAKTMLIDDDLAVVGTANMDVRSQELNFEVNTMLYDREINEKLFLAFEEDLKSSTEIFLKDWENRSKGKVFFEHLARLMSPLM